MYKYIQGIENRLPNSDFEAFFQYTLRGARAGIAYDNDNITGPLDIAHNSNLVLEFKKAYTVISDGADLDPLWEISCLTCKDGGAGFLTVLPEGEKLGAQGYTRAR